MADRNPVSAQALVGPVHGAVAARLAGQDQDQEVKDAAIAATAALVATLGDELRAQVPALLQARIPGNIMPYTISSAHGKALFRLGVPGRLPGSNPLTSCARMQLTLRRHRLQSICSISCHLLGTSLKSNQYRRVGGLQVLLERLRNEITRLMAVKALADIARSLLALPLDAALQPALPDLTSFLRKANRQLRQASLSALQVRWQLCPRMFHMFQQLKTETLARCPDHVSAVRARACLADAAQTATVSTAEQKNLRFVQMLCLFDTRLNVFCAGVSGVTQRRAGRGGRERGGRGGGGAGQRQRSDGHSPDPAAGHRRAAPPARGGPNRRAEGAPPWSPWKLMLQRRITNRATASCGNHLVLPI